MISEHDLDRDLVFDGLDIYENTRYESEDGKIYVFLRYPLLNSEKKASFESTNSFLFIISKKNIITVSKNNLPIFDKLIKSKAFLSENPIKSLLIVLHHISRAFEDNVRVVLKSVNKDRANVSRLTDNDILSLVLYEDTVNDYVSSFPLLLRLIENIRKSKSFKLTYNEEEFIQDLFIDLNQTLEICKSSLKSISNIRNYYSTKLSTKLNKTINLLTLFTIFLTIPAVISSIYGMNIDLPFQSASNILVILFSLTFGIWAVLFFIFKKIGLF